MEWTYKGKTREEWAKLIRKQRRAVDITQQELAGYVNVATSTIAHIETGRMFPSEEKLEKILIVLKIEENGV